MYMLEISKITLQNFLSYGDYETTLELDSLNTCLILGELADGEDMDVSENSNGAGKSAVVNAILWCLFGRTMHKSNPGDKVINYYTGKNCKVEILFKNGDKLIRTRNCDGHNDLLLIKDGQDVSLGTTKMQQAMLNKELGLDWDLFCGSTFFSQFGGSWMSMSDMKRKEALEREFHMDRIKIYATIAKEKRDKAEAEQSRVQNEIMRNQALITQYQREIDNLAEASDNFESEKRNRLEDAVLTYKRLKESRDSIELIDIDILKQKHAEVDALEDRLRTHERAISNLTKQYNKLLVEIDHKAALIRKWKSKGDFCPSCEQSIPESHIKDKIGDPQKELRDLKDKANQLDADISSKSEKLELAWTKVKAKRPEMTIADATRNNDEWERRNENLNTQSLAIKKIKEEKNHYGRSIDNIKSEIEKCRSIIDDLDNRVSKLDTILNHLSYIYKAYHDRRKIKSHILQEYVPYLNERVAHYLNMFKISDLKIEFTNALSIKSNLWGYEFYSGGERKRVDVSIMLALFDLHYIMYGRQCNIMVFDEVDQHLDKKGAEIFADLIRSDFASKVDTILVISHRPDMKGMFSTEITVRREDRFSKIYEVIT